MPGDGIGPEVVDAARRVLDASGAPLEWDVQLIGQPALDAGASDPLPDSVLDSIRRSRAALKGPVTTRRGGGFRSPNIGLRRALDLYLQVRRVRTFPGVATRAAPVDLVVIRETTEDLYAGIEFPSGSEGADELAGWLADHGSPVGPASGISIKAISPEAVRRAAAFALDWAGRNGRQRVTVVHKATVMRATDGLFLETVRDVAREHPEVEVDDHLVDDVAMRLARRPEDFDVLLTSNLYGDVLADLGAGLVGSPGLVAGANYGTNAAVFEAGHGSAPKHAGTDRANPTGLILSGALLLHHLGETEAAERVEGAVADVLRDGRSLTYDVVPDGATPAGTAAFADAVASRLH